MNEYIKIVGARTHNLKNVNVVIPKKSLVFITGVSGSGKSSLAFDTIHAEGRLRFIESLSLQTRQVIEQVDKPDVEFIQGLTPTIAIAQDSYNNNPRSTLATISEIHRLFQILFSRIGLQDDNKKFEPNHFSFNSPFGMCSVCKGTGKKLTVDQQSLIKDFETTLNEGAILVWKNESGNYYDNLLKKVCEECNINMDMPLKEFKKNEIDILLYGSGERKFKISYKGANKTRKTKSVPFQGIIPFIENRIDGKDNIEDTNTMAPFLLEEKCDSCKGYRLNKSSLNVRIANLNIGELEDKSIKECMAFFDRLPNILNKIDTEISSKLLPVIRKKLFTLSDMNLSYLQLNRAINTLSGGEFQRIRLATQLSSSLSGITYILDEPSKNLHPKDMEKIIKSLKKLKNQDNTVIVVEHNLEMIKNADYIIDIGPLAGVLGGELLAAGSLKEVKNNRQSKIGDYLSGKRKIDIPENYRQVKHKITFNGCSVHNLKNVNVNIPIGILVAITGVSGSGKSTLVDKIVYPAVSKKQAKKYYDSAINLELLKGAIRVNQASIGRSIRSNPATYIGLFDDIRELFTVQPESISRNYKKSQFSFNLKDGCCENCSGEGTIKYDMSFLPEVSITCPVCKGKRYNDETLQILYRSHSIYDVLLLTVDEALNLFDKQYKITEKLSGLKEVGLGYITLGQSSTTLSGGEAQRIKLAKELYSKRKSYMYILDEPSNGLHMDDIFDLIAILKKIIDLGNTVLMVEHNLQLVKNADYLIDMGLKGGDEGGQILIEGSPKTVAASCNSFTGTYLKKIFDDK